MQFIAATQKDGKDLWKRSLTKICILHEMIAEQRSNHKSWGLPSLERAALLQSR